MAAGILLSRTIGLVRDAAIASYLGAGAHADVFRAALRGPNVLQNLLGEGTISAAFIPAYTRLVHEGREEDAGRLAGAILGLLIAVAAALSALGVLFARPIVAVLTPGFLLDDPGGVDRYALAVEAVRIVFPMTGVLVVSAWALGVLNSHRRFFLSYAAPVLWNAAILAALVAAARSWLPLEFAGGDPRDRLLIAACLGALAGALLQLLVQLGPVLRLLRGFRISVSTRVAGVRDVLRAVGPAIAGRGVAQLSSWIDLVLASWLAAGAVAVLGWAQTLYLLPISLFGMSVAAAELPELARARDSAEALAARTRAGLAQMGFLVIPTALGYIAFGVPFVEAVYRRGAFGESDAWLVALALGAYSLGLLATTWSRLLQNAFYALGETAPPARIAALRMGLAALLSVPLMLALDRVPLTSVAGFLADTGSATLGATGLALASAVGAWMELLLLRARLRQRLPALSLPVERAARLVALASFAGLPAGALWWLAAGAHPTLRGLSVVGAYAVCYLLMAWVAKVPEARAWLDIVRRRGGSPPAAG